MNILIMAMSTYPHELKHLVAENTESGALFSYFSQLEPGCKHLFTELGSQEKRFDKVITLCTPETLMCYPNKSIIHNKAEEIDISDISPYDFFKKRMLSYIMNDDFAFGYEKQLGIDINAFKHFDFSDLYTAELIETLFDEPVLIKKSELEIDSAIRDVIERINNTVGNKKEKIRLYINAQGGSRVHIQIINTVMNMLKSRDYQLMEVCAADYNNVNPQIGVKLLNVTRSYLITDLAAAMNAFLQYGRGDMFTDYYKRYKKERCLDEAPEDKIIEVINSISEAMLLCDIDGFLESIDDLKAAISEYDMLPAYGKDPFFEVIKNDITKSYKELFDSDDIIGDMDVLVDWCLKRKLLQQAVTILEAKAPLFVFRYGFLYGKKDEATRLGLIALRQMTSPQQDYKFKHPMYYFINTFCIMNARKASNASTNNPYKIETHLDIYEKLSDLKKQTYSYDFSNNSESVYLGVYSDLISCSCNGFDEIQKSAAKIAEFVSGYRKMCYIRNDFNHGNIRLNKVGYKYINDQVSAFNAVLKNIKKMTANYTIDNRPFFENGDIRR